MKRLGSSIISYENLGSSMKSLRSPMKIWGTPMKIWEYPIGLWWWRFFPKLREWELLLKNGVKPQFKSLSTGYGVSLELSQNPKQMFVSLDMSNYICEVILTNFLKLLYFKLICLRYSLSTVPGSIYQIN